MKTRITLCILLFTFFINQVFSQNNFRWADSGAVWHYNNRTPIFTWAYRHSWYDNDTTINGIECQQIRSEKQYRYQTGPTSFVTVPIAPDSTFYVYRNGTNVFTLRFCLSCLKNVSISHRLL